MHVLAAFDKFRGTLTATEACEAACAGAVGHTCVRQPIADGGEGTLEAFGGANRRTTVTDPLGRQVDAAWRLADGLAVIEMAQASGLALVGGRNDPVGATTRGTGELIRAALDEGAHEVLVGVGGSATTDGGWGVVDVFEGRRFDVPVVVATDVTTRFVDAAATFGPQKGAGPAAVEHLRDRLEHLAERYASEFGVDVRQIAGSGAAGGLAGGLAALGARIMPGFDLVAERLGLRSLVASSDLVITGEGKLDATSFHGKAVGGMLRLANEEGTPALVVAGTVDLEYQSGLRVVSLVERFGEEAAFSSPADCLTRIAAEAAGGG